MNTFLRTLFIKFSFDTKARMRVWRKLAMQAKYNISPYQGVKTLLRQARERKKPEVYLYQLILEGKTQGVSFASCLKGYVTPEEISLISSAEKAGDIGQGFTMSYDFLQNKGAIAKATKGLIQPLILILVCIAFLLVVAKLVVPQFSLLLPASKWTGLAAYLYSVANVVNSIWGALAGIALFLGIVAMFVSLPLLTGPIRKKIDGIGPWAIYRSVVGIGWLFTLATLMRAKMDVYYILTLMVREQSNTPYLRERVLAILHHFADGKSLGDALKSCGMNFPSPDLVADIVIYSELPDMQNRLFEIAKDQMLLEVEEIQAKMQRINSVLQVLVAFIVGFFIMSTIDLESQLGNAF